MFTQNTLVIFFDTTLEENPTYYILEDTYKVTDEAIIDLLDVCPEEFILVEDISKLPLPTHRIVEYI